jgi:glycosyltransferase involved in cell wall biosynthesis
MARGPLVSIVIDNYNYGRFLKDSIESALSQRYPNTEVVVVDDGSTDDSRKIISQYAHSLVAVLKENGGQGSAFNAGFARSRGDIVIFLDADDFLFDHAASTIVDNWEPCVGQVQCAIFQRDLRARSPQVLLPLPRLTTSEIRARILNCLSTAGPPIHGVGYSRKLLERLLPLPENLWRTGADTPIRLLSPFLGEVVRVQRPIGVYCRHGENDSAMSEMGPHGVGLSVSLRKIRDRLVRDSQARALLKNFLCQRGTRLREDWLFRSPAHLGLRLIHKRLASGNHPFPDDRREDLLMAGIRACLNCPEFSVPKRLVYPLLMLGAAYAPRRVVHAAYRLRLRAPSTVRVRL